MPKELIHFKIAERTAILLRETRFAPCLKACTNGLLLGSVFHDALLYGVTPLHGAAGQDTFTLLRLQAEHAASSKDKGLPAAFLVGMASHVIADATMHPMIWHFTGNYYAEDKKEKSLAIQRHRALEALMDMVACPEMLGCSQYSLRRMLFRIKDGLTEAIPLKQLAAMTEMSTVKTRKGLSSAWRVFSILQSLYPIRPLARGLFAILPCLPRPFAEIATLFYAPQLMLQAGGISGDIKFQDPATGEKETSTLDGLIDSASKRASELCKGLEAGIFNGEDLDFRAKGPSMEAGLPGVATKSMRHYAVRPFPDLP